MGEWISDENDPELEEHLRRRIAEFEEEHKIKFDRAMRHAAHIEEWIVKYLENLPEEANHYDSRK